MAGCNVSQPASRNAAAKAANESLHSAGESKAAGAQHATHPTLDRPSLATFNHDGVYIATRPRAKGPITSLLANGGGKLAIVNRCVFFRMANGQLIMPFFVEDAVRWDAPTKTFYFEGKPYREGAMLTLGGGFLRADLVRRNGNHYSEIIDHCKPDGFFTVGG